MSFIQWAVLVIIGFFTLTFCIFTILDRILKYKEKKHYDHSIETYRNETTMYITALRKRIEILEANEGGSRCQEKK